MGLAMTYERVFWCLVVFDYALGAVLMMSAPPFRHRALVALTWPLSLMALLIGGITAIEWLERRNA